MNGLVEYIKASFAKGLKKSQVEENLLQAGWLKGQIVDAFERIETSQKEFVEKHRKRILPSKKVLLL